jgi:tRNA U34 5-methylaminomethyl-2-thiouridine-forming methyltransferase MnmC
MHLSDMENVPADRRILRTGDGSLTVVVGADGPTYHSRAGALTESRHVFIAAGLAAVAADRDPVDVFEVGFGTGLNAALAWQWARTTGRYVRYRACEPFPLPPALARPMRDHPPLKETAKQLTTSTSAAPMKSHQKVGLRIQMF